MEGEIEGSVEVTGIRGRRCKWLLDDFRSHYGPGVDSASNTNEYLVYFLGVKAAGAGG